MGIPDTIDIRRVEGDEVARTAQPLWAYAFSPSPAPVDEQRQRAAAKYRTDNVTLVAFGADGEAEATATGIPMLQNLRGTMVPSMGVSAVATHPRARRRGLVRALLGELEREMRERHGCVVGTLYPFDPHFYERFGYVEFPPARRVRLETAGMAELLRGGEGAGTVPDGEVVLRRIGEGDAHERFSGLLRRVAEQRHGLALHPASRTAEMRDENGLWLAEARVGGETRGALTYRTTGHNGVMDQVVPLALDVNAHRLLVRFLALHVGQFAEFRLELGPDDPSPNRWYTGARFTEDTRVGPGTNAPMGTVLDPAGLAGLRGVGAARVVVGTMGGRWEFDGTSGTLEVRELRDESTVDAKVTRHGLSGLVFGVLDPSELAFRGYGHVADTKAESNLRTLFPEAAPYLLARF